MPSKTRALIAKLLIKRIDSDLKQTWEFGTRSEIYELGIAEGKRQASVGLEAALDADCETLRTSDDWYREQIHPGAWAANFLSAGEDDGKLPEWGHFFRLWLYCSLALHWWFS
jgi:hypothetical protein